jgi:V/A-type H+-transporting ATPase subunit I
MQKILIASYHTEAADVLEALQTSGLVQIYDAQRAIVSKEWPELHTEVERPKQIEDLSAKIDSAVEFLNQFSPKPTFAQVLAPRAVISAKEYTAVIRTDESLQMLEECNELSNQLHKFRDQQEHLAGQLSILLPWEKLGIDLADLEKFEKGAAILGLVPEKNLALISEKIKDFKAGFEKIGYKDGLAACVVITLKENSAEVYKALRSIEFEAVNLSQFKGTPAELITNIQKQLDDIHQQTASLEKQAYKLSKNRLQLQILADHYRNLLDRERTRLAVPESEKTVILEGWIKKHDLKKLQDILAKFKGTSLNLIKPAQDEEIPVEIENTRTLKPFEVITRLYGMPQYLEVDPTWLLAPFFAIFFALCLADVGAALIIIAICAFLIKKMQGDKKLFYLLIVCGILTIGTGAMTGGWFGTGLRELATAWKIDWLAKLIDRTLWFDPLSDPMKFFAISVALGYLQIMMGLFVGFVVSLRRKDYAAAIYDKLSWLIWVNSLVVFLAAKAGKFSAAVGSVAIIIAIVPAIAILLFSQREGSIGARLGMGLYQLFSTVFYLGDVLSYLRLMALGISSAGVAMAVNVIAKIVSDVPYVGMILMIIFLILGHILTTASSVLGSFVHTMRLQFVEYFPKFLVGGGKEFMPLSKQYKYVYIKSDKVEN